MGGVAPCGGRLSGWAARPRINEPLGPRPCVSLRPMRLFVVCLAVILAAAEARAQTPPADSGQTAVSLPATMCKLQVPAPAKLPPAGTGPYTYIIIPCFEKQGGIPVVDAQ